MGKITHMYEDKVSISHEEKAIPVIIDIIKKFNPDMMIELGTSKGGFTYVLNMIFPDVELHSFDWKVKGMDRNLFNKNVYFYATNILSNKQKLIVNLCKSVKKKLLYCDNGNKIKEVHMYSGYLNSGDMLGVHDWNKEIRYKDISKQLEDFERIKENDILKSVGGSSRFWIKK